MKLRNKKTGEIRKAEAREDGIYLWDELTGHWWKYELDLLASSWEYYVEPKEPLIKDEKIRKVVRAWAEVNATPEVQYDRYGDCICSPYGLDRTGTTVSISFDDIYALKELKHMQSYTIAELCGEEEE